MPEISEELHQQIEAAYDYRGHVTVAFKSGETLEGFVSNRQFSNPKLPEDNFIEIFPKGKDELKRFKIAEIAAIELTGKDFAETFAQSSERMKGEAGKTEPKKA